MRKSIHGDQSAVSKQNVHAVSCAFSTFCSKTNDPFADISSNDISCGHASGEINTSTVCSPSEHAVCAKAESPAKTSKQARRAIRFMGPIYGRMPPPFSRDTLPSLASVAQDKRLGFRSDQRKVHHSNALNCAQAKALLIFDNAIQASPHGTRSRPQRSQAKRNRRTRRFCPLPFCHRHHQHLLHRLIDPRINSRLQLPYADGVLASFLESFSETPPGERLHLVCSRVPSPCLFQMGANRD